MRLRIANNVIDCLVLAFARNAACAAIHNILNMLAKCKRPRGGCLDEGRMVVKKAPKPAAKFSERLRETHTLFGLQNKQVTEITVSARNVSRIIVARMVSVCYLPNPRRDPAAWRRRRRHLISFGRKDKLKQISERDVGAPASQPAKLI